MTNSMLHKQSPPQEAATVAIPDKEPQRIRQMFNRIAPTYDLLNDCISLGMHRQWKRQACRNLRLPAGGSVLDVCTGTGDLVSELLPLVSSHGSVTGLDFSEEMLAVARARFPQSAFPNTHFIQGDAMALPFDDNSFDGAIISFGLRNVADITRTLSEMQRVIKPGGWMINLDTSPNPKLPGYWLYFSTVMPIIGRLLSQDTSAYKYLFASTRSFLTPEALCDIMHQLGLQAVSADSLGFGAVSMQTGQKQKS